MNLFKDPEKKLSGYLSMCIMGKAVGIRLKHTDTYKAG